MTEKARLKHIHKNHNVAVQDDTCVVDNTADPKFYCKNDAVFAILNAKMASDGVWVVGVCGCGVCIPLGKDSVA